jgi:hypothetical protein
MPLLFGENVHVTYSPNIITQVAGEQRLLVEIPGQACSAGGGQRRCTTRRGSSSWRQLLDGDLSATVVLRAGWQQWLLQDSKSLLRSWEASGWVLNGFDAS